jgi:hypothetical protein
MNVSIKKGANGMTQRRQITIKQCAVTDVMSHLSKLPEREKDPGVLLSLSEIFRTKEYAVEIKGALKKGYTFDDLAEIFSERCGAAVTARQLKYHYTRAKNMGTKKKTGVKAEWADASKNGDLSVIPPQKDTEGDREGETSATTDSPAKDAPKPADLVQNEGTARTSEIRDFFYNKYTPVKRA